MNPLPHLIFLIAVSAVIYLASKKFLRGDFLAAGTFIAGVVFLLGILGFACWALGVADPLPF